jgi:hypothetical protein
MGQVPEVESAVIRIQHRLPFRINTMNSDIWSKQSDTNPTICDTCQSVYSTLRYVRIHSSLLSLPGRRRSTFQEDCMHMMIRVGEPFMIELGHFGMDWQQSVRQASSRTLRLNICRFSSCLRTFYRAARAVKKSGDGHWDSVPSPAT